MGQENSNVDSLLAQAGLLPDSSCARRSMQESDVPGADSLSGLTASFTDLDTDLLGVKLDDCSRYFKKEIMGFFLDSKTKLTYEGRALAEAEQLKGANQLAASQARLEAVKQELYHERQITAKSNVLLNRMASSYATARHYAHQNHLVALAMFEWHSFARQQKAMRQHLRHAVKHYDGRKLQGQVFQHWKRWCNLEGRANMFVQKQEVISRKMEAAKQAAWGEAGLIIDDLQAALADVKQQLCNERAAHDQLEEDMKQSFMRSVCAINLEAMSVMKRGMPPGGVNPVPIKVAVKDTFASPVKGQPGQPDKPSFVAAELNSQGEAASLEAKNDNGDKDLQGSLSTVEEESDALPSSDMHHPILGMKSPLQRLRPPGDSTSIAAEPAQVASAGPVRQSSAINFNAALGRWDPPARPASARIVHKGSAAALANVKMSQPHVLQSMKAISAQAQPQQPSSTGQAVSGSEQHAQDLRPRSSDGILQRITVDRGPAKGNASAMRPAPAPLQRRSVQRLSRDPSQLV